MTNEILPWANEPNYLIWTDEETGYLCLISRHTPLPSSDYEFKHLCGNVLVPKDHVATSVNFEDYSDAAIIVKVHGSVTFDSYKTILVADDFSNGNQAWYWKIPIEVARHRYYINNEQKKCTTELASGFMVGFDCGHADDDIAFKWQLSQSDRSYKDINYVKNECKSLAKQLYNMASCPDLWAELAEAEEQVKVVKRKINAVIQGEQNDSTGTN